MLKKTIYLIFTALNLFRFLNAQESFMVKNLMNHVYTLASDSMEGRGFGFTGKRPAVNYIAAEFKSVGIEPINGSYINTFLHRSGLYKVEGLNVVGIIEGSDPALKSEYIVIGAHLDHMGYELKGGEKVIYNGADDNASGVAVLIEIGRQLAENKALLKRSVIFVAFDGEEAGLIGSGEFVSDKTADPEQVKIMFSLDMVGNYEKNEGVEFNGLKSLLMGEEILNEVATKKDIQVRKSKETIEMRTDTWSFAKEGIPSVHVFTGETSTYHKPDDDSHLLDYKGMGRIVELMVDFTRDLSGKDNLLANPEIMKKSTAPLFQAGISYRVGAGSFHYKDEFFNAKPLLAFEAGLVTQFKVSENFTLQPVFMYSSNASQSEEGNTRMHSVSPQLNFLLTTANTLKDKPFGYLLLGGYYRYHFAGSVSGHSADFESEYNRDETGLQLGFGFQVYNFQIGFTSKYGLTSIFRDDGAAEVLSSGRFFSFTYFF